MRVGFDRDGELGSASARCDQGARKIQAAPELVWGKAPVLQVQWVDLGTVQREGELVQCGGERDWAALQPPSIGHSSRPTFVEDAAFQGRPL